MTLLKAIIAFSGEHKYGGAQVSEATLNGFSNNDIAAKIKIDQRFMKDDLEFYKQLVQNPSFHRFLSDAIYAINTAPALPPSHP